MTGDSREFAEAAEVRPALTASPSGPARFRFRLVPMLVVIALAVMLTLFPAVIVDTLSDYIPLPVHGSNLAFLYAHHAVLLLLALAAIWLISQWVPADYGLHLPEGRSYVATAIIIGFLFGLLMTVVDYGPQIVARVAPQLDYRLSVGNVIGWLFFEGVYVGPTEEVPFRALLVTYLAATMPGRVRIFRLEMNGAGVVVAAIFALAHIGNFLARPFLIALGQQFYAFGLGIAYAYWLEKSRSILAPILGHNVSDVTEQILLFIMVAAWGL
ncbi:MAG: CPBP family intramembrane metalloprotease [Alphaproteobacteria bacterium]|nr:CPBP family intramembrane metalloprotease [Alphaproteobacteria bacterium]